MTSAAYSNKELSLALQKKGIEAYPVKMTTYLAGLNPYDLNTENRLVYIEGYNQAEKDNELCWEDIFSIFRLVNEVLDDYADGKTKKEVGEEVLKRFKAQKGDKI